MATKTKFKGITSDCGKVVQQWLQEAESNGWRIDWHGKRCLWMVFPADGSTAFSVHTTYSSRHVIHKLRRKFRNAGLPSLQEKP